MKVFVSWSGELSRGVAAILREWLPSVIQAVEPFMSSEDIRKGARWIVEIGKQLEVSSGILCITRDNVGAPWLNFEAGALAKVIDQARVVPFLIGLRPGDIEGPLAQFQATVFEKEDVWKLIVSLNQQAGTPLAEERLRKTFEMWWGDLESKINGVMKTAGSTRVPGKVDPRDVPERVTEILELVREQGRAIALLSERVVERSPIAIPPGSLPPGSVVYTPGSGSIPSASSKFGAFEMGSVIVSENGEISVYLADGRKLTAGNPIELERVLVFLGAKEPQARRLARTVIPGGEYIFSFREGVLTFDEILRSQKRLDPPPTNPLPQDLPPSGNPGGRI